MNGTCEGCNGDGGCPVHDPPTCKRCKSEYTMDWPHTEPTAYCDACAHAVAGELTADLATAIAERDEARRALAECERERDALKAGKWAGAWRWDDTGEWCSRHRPNEDVHTVELAMRGTGFMWRFRFEAGEQAGSLDAAKAAADAHLVAAGWYLEGGPHGAGEAK